MVKAVSILGSSKGVSGTVFFTQEGNACCALPVLLLHQLIFSASSDSSSSPSKPPRLEQKLQSASSRFFRLFFIGSSLLSLFSFACGCGDKLRHWTGFPNSLNIDKKVELILSDVNTQYDISDVLDSDERLGFHV
ncbi:hypothetical protein CDL15_Pgr007914 [Punica granatum]|uniref:Uncharacterized protein n=1 Tax=Punica granatum TaxID=22663 RepID=A0A218XAZ4_PUNGR|nr:hypothetical protein CDL15_Pgr007914 [Punica granatum]